MPLSSKLSIELTPVGDSYPFEKKILDFYPGQAIPLGFENLGLYASPKNGLFCAWALAENHAWLYRDIDDGVCFFSCF